MDKIRGIACLQPYYTAPRTAIPALHQSHTGAAPVNGTHALSHAADLLPRRLEEAFGVAMDVLGRRVRPGVSEVGR